MDAPADHKPCLACGLPPRHAPGEIPPACTNLLCAESGADDATKRRVADLADFIRARGGRIDEVIDNGDGTADASVQLSRPLERAVFSYMTEKRVEKN